MKLRPYIPDTDFDEIKNWITDERTHAMWCANRMSFPPENNCFGEDAYVATSDDGELIGFFCYSVNRDTDEGMLKFIMNNPKFRGKGYGKEMLRLAVAYAFEETNVGTVGLNVFSVNERARKCYESVGFVERRTDKDAYVYKDELWDRCNMIIKKSEIIQN